MKNSVFYMVLSGLMATIMVYGFFFPDNVIENSVIYSGLMSMILIVQSEVNEIKERMKA